MKNYLPNKQHLFTAMLLTFQRPKSHWPLRLALCGLAGLSTHMVMAQTTASVNGVVRDEQGQTISSATVTIENPNGFRRAATSGADGTFTFTDISEGKGYTIRIVSLGYKAKTLPNYTITAADKISISVTLEEDLGNIEEVVVTALGIKRDKKALGYSVTELKGDELTQGKEANVANALSGKVAGVQVSRAASGAGGSAKVIIRGNNSLVGNSQPLYVIDGVPMDNQNIGSASQSGGTDYGDGIGNINPDDIETMSVLKGPNAAALYGQRGSNGVILITTKSGKAGRTSFNFNTDYSIGNGLILPDFQNEYGQGLNGTFTHFRKDDGTIVSMADAIANNFSGMPKMSAGRDRTTRASWGPRMEGQTYEDMYGNILQLNPVPDTYSSFFQTEKQRVNNLSVDGGNDKVNYRFSFSNTNVDGYVPNNKLNRHNFGLRSQGKITDKFNIDVKANYILQEAENRPTLSDANDNPAYLFISQPRSLSNAISSQYKWTADDVRRQLGFSGVFEGLEKTYATNSSTANPFWTVNENHNEDRRDRIIGLLRLSYDFFSWLKVTATGGTDFYTDQRFRYRPINTYQSTNRKGDLREEVLRNREDNFDILASSNFEVNEDIKMSFNLGGSHQNRYLRVTGNDGRQFIVPNLYVINNTTTNSYIFDLVESQINSAYLSGQFSFKDYWFVDFSARNDWSSTLAKDNNSFFYPSISSSLVLTDAFKWSSPTISYAKIRGSWAQAGSSGNPYQLTGAYTLNQYTHGGIPMASYTDIIPDPNLRNELTTSIEAGADLRMLQNRLSLSFTYYQAITKNQILDVPVSPSSLYVKNRINAGEISNRGFEFMISGTPIKTSSFEWTSQFNFNRNKNKVESLYPGIPTFLLATDRGIDVVAEVGKPFGQLKGTQFAWIKDDQGNRLIDPDTGLPLRTSGRTETDLGNAQPDWIGGFSNTFNYKGISLYALVDIRQGGVTFSQSNREQIIYGTSTKTLEGREGTYVAEGVVASKDANGAWVSSGVTNTKQVKAQDYWNIVASDKEVMVSEEMINDMSYIAMREISLSYNLPKQWMPTTWIRHAKLGLYGRNLFYFQRKTDGFSPEASAFNIHNSSIGIESTSLPMMRNFGINLNIGL